MFGEVEFLVQVSVSRNEGQTLIAETRCLASKSHTRSITVFTAGSEAKPSEEESSPCSFSLLPSPQIGSSLEGFILGQTPGLRGGGKRFVCTWESSLQGGKTFGGGR